MTYQRINEMPASEIAVHMGSLASVQEAECLRRIAMEARWGDAAVEDVPDALWFHWVELAAKAQTLEGMNARLLAAGYSPLDAEDAALYQSTNPADAEQREALIEDLKGRVLGVHR